MKMNAPDLRARMMMTMMNAMTMIRSPPPPTPAITATVSWLNVSSSSSSGGGAAATVEDVDVLASDDGVETELDGDVLGQVVPLTVVDAVEDLVLADDMQTVHASYSQAHIHSSRIRILRILTNS